MTPEEKERWRYASERFQFASINDALAWSKHYCRMIYCELFGQVGVFQVYPGGRSIKWPSTGRFFKRLTSDEELRKGWEAMAEIERRESREKP
jgi:hypothetical protein